MSASFPMYDWPEIRAATDAWWRGLAEALRAEGLENVPDTLLRDVDMQELWAAPDLLISQTCGYPLTHSWSGRLMPVAVPHYNVEGCDGADYCSFIVVRRDAAAQDLEALRGCTAAYNSEDSQSGYSALRAVFAPLAQSGNFFGATVRSGGHLNSLQMVASGEADVCAVDAVVWTLARRYRAELCAGLRALARSPSAPGLPYVTSPGVSGDDLQRIRAGLRAAFDAPALSDVRADLFLCGLSEVSTDKYERILQMERDSAALGYDAVR